MINLNVWHSRTFLRAIKNTGEMVAARGIRVHGTWKNPRRLTGVESRWVIAAVIEIKLLLSERGETFSMCY